MRVGTIVGAAGVAVASLAFNLAGCGGGVTPPEIDLSPGIGAIGMAHAPRFVVGDTIGLALRSGATPRLTYTLPHFVAASVSATFTSSDTSLAAVSPTGQVIAVSPGEVTITATDSANPQSSAAKSFRVVTPRQAANEVALEVCPNESESVFLASSPLSGLVHDIHEFHDCQQLIEDNDYVSLVGIFAHQNVRTYNAWQDFRSGRLASIIVNFGDKNAVSYTWLGLVPGTSCLVLRATAYDRWQAAVVPAPGNLVSGGKVTRYGRCRDDMTWPEETVRGVTFLSVVPQHGVDLLGRPVVPPVARWDWDERHDRNYIGVRCDSLTWCEIGPRGFVPSEPITIAVPPARTRRTVIKGYYDQQYLANENGDEPTKVFGTIFPGEDLKANGQIDPKNPNATYHVAEISFREKRLLPSSEFRRYVKRYRKEDVPVVENTLTHARSTSYRVQPILDPPDEYGYYRGSLNSHALPDSAILFHYHPGLKDVPPTVRWRWDIKDELTWFSCPGEGCCEKVKLLPTGL